MTNFPERDRDREPHLHEIYIRWKVEEKVLHSEIATHLGDGEGEIFLALAAALRKLGHDTDITDDQLARWFRAYLYHDEAGLRELLEPVEAKG